jgi:hypothetical protein
MNDDKLINKAISIPDFNWQEIVQLIDQAEKEETKRILENIMKGKYHSEEYNSGLL